MTYADGRYGALDIGTVTCRLLVADVEDGRIIDVDKEYAITDLGVGVDATGRLSEAAIERVLACVDRYLEVLARYDTPEHPVRRLIAMATSASRDAANGPEFAARLAERGVTLAVIPGSREAQLTFLGASSDFPGENLLVVDIGGGSTGHAHLEIRVIGEAAGMGAHRRRLARTTIRRNASRCVEGNDIRLSWHGSSLVLSLPGFVSGAGSQSKAGRLSVRRRGAPCSQVEATDERAPFLEGGIADGVFHLAGLDFRHLGLDPQGLGQKVEEHAMAVEHRPTVGVARLGQRDVAVVRLHDQLLLLQSGDGLVHRRFGNAQLVGHIHRAHGRVGRAAQHDDGLEVILVRHGRFHHSNLLIEQVRSS